MAGGHELVGDVCAGGVCMVEGMYGRGGIHGRGVCMAGGHAWWGACMAGEHVWWGGVCVADTIRYGQSAGGTHPTGMHSCHKCNRNNINIYNRKYEIFCLFFF